MKIKIDENFYIDCSDRSNFTLKEIYPATRDGELTGETAERVHGYYASFQQALQRFIDKKLPTTNASDIKEAIQACKAINATIAALGDLSRAKNAPRSDVPELVLQ